MGVVGYLHCSVFDVVHCALVVSHRLDRIGLGSVSQLPRCRFIFSVSMFVSLALVFLNFYDFF
jgi:hypothetical protein